MRKLDEIDCLLDAGRLAEARALIEELEEMAGITPDGKDKKR